MNLLNRIAKVIVFKTSFLWPDRIYLKFLYRFTFGKKLDLYNPLTYSEKLQWLKLYNRCPKYVTMVDKYAVKDYVAKIIGDEHVIPTLGVWERPEDIDWNSLPNMFVLKCTHDSGGLIICRDKTEIDKREAIKKLNRSLKRDYYRMWREWPYKNVPRRIIAEKYIIPDEGKNDLPDYKFFCFDGEVKFLFVATERQNPNEDVKFDFFDENYNSLPFRQGHDHAKILPQKPLYFDEMKKAAAKLSEGMPHARVDFYETSDGFLFGEITLFHFSGLVPFEPVDWDYKIGELLTLPPNHNYQLK